MARSSWWSTTAGPRPPAGTSACARSSGSPPAPSATAARSSWSALRPIRRAPTMRRLSATDAVRTASSWKPKPWPVDRMAALEQLRQEPLDGAEIVWLSDGVADGPAARAAARRFAQELDKLGPLQVFAEPLERRAPLLLPPEIEGERLKVAARRAGGGKAHQSAIKALGPTGEVLARQSLTFDGDATQSGGAVRAAARPQQPYRALRARAAAGGRRRGPGRRALAAPRGRPGRRIGGTGAPAAAVGAVLHRAGAGVPRGNAPRLGRPADRRRGVGDRAAGRRPGQQRRPRAAARLGRQRRGAPALCRTPPRQCR